MTTDCDYCVLLLIDCVHLCLHKGGQPQSSRSVPLSTIFALEEFCGINAPFQWDREQHVMAVMCRQHIVVLASSQHLIPGDLTPGGWQFAAISADTGDVCFLNICIETLDFI